MYGQVINLLALAGLRTVFGVAGPGVTNLLTMAGLWTLLRYNHGLHVHWQFCLYPKFVHKPARVSRFVTLGLTTPKSVHRPAKVSWLLFHIRKVSIDQPGSAGQ